MKPTDEIRCFLYSIAASIPILHFIPFRAVYRWCTYKTFFFIPPFDFFLLSTSLRSPFLSVTARSPFCRYVIIVHVVFFFFFFFFFLPGCMSHHHFWRWHDSTSGVLFILFSPSAHRAIERRSIYFWFVSKTIPVDTNLNARYKYKLCIFIPPWSFQRLISEGGGERKTKKTIVEKNKKKIREKGEWKMLNYENVRALSHFLIWFYPRAQYAPAGLTARTPEFYCQSRRRFICASAEFGNPLAHGDRPAQDRPWTPGSKKSGRVL